MLLTPPLSLYLHFPWCVSKCPYCDFNSHALRGPLDEERYVAALESDLQAQSAALAGRALVSIFLGGGTPSLFSPRAIARVLATARTCLAATPDLEVTMEANPGTIERGRFAEYLAAGVTRVSLGAQSFDDASLRALGRIHSSDETRRAAAELHAAGLTNFNLDLMYGLPGQTLQQALADMQAALALAPAHISHYQLTLEPGTVFAAQRPVLPDDELAAQMLEACMQCLEDAGFARYEVSAYAKPARRCRHNLNYWSFGDYLGAGAGAHGKLSLPESGCVVRTVHAREPRRYLAHCAAVTARRVPRADLPFEFMLNALRLVAGFERALFESRTGLAWEVVTGPLAQLASRGLVHNDGSQWRATPHGMRFLNDVLLHFLPETPKTTGGFALSTAV